jgi:hypothetical protein
VEYPLTLVMFIVAFQNLIVIKISDPSDPVEFCKIWYNSIKFQLEEVLYSKTPKNQKIGQICRLIRPNWPKFDLIHPKFGGIVEVIEVFKK